MPGTVAGGHKARDINYARHGKDFYRRIGQKGGSSPKSKPCGFQARPDIVSSAGKKGGAVSKKGFKVLGHVGNIYTYQHKETGKIYEVDYRTHLVPDKPKEVKHGKGKKGKGKTE